MLALEDGRIFHGRAAGANTRRGGEVVFNTSLTGYQEVFTDPSYTGQIVCLTYPHIGNVGANLDDEEAPRPYLESPQDSCALGYRHARAGAPYSQRGRAARHRGDGWHTCGTVDLRGQAASH